MTNFVATVPSMHKVEYVNNATRVFRVFIPLEFLKTDEAIKVVLADYNMGHRKK